MKFKITQHFQKRWQDYASFLLMLVIIFAMMYHLMGLNQFKLDVPMSYYGGDDMGVIVNAKMFTEQGWNLTSDRLGAPYSVQYYDFTTSMLHNVGLAIMKVFAVITHDAAAAMNLTYLSVFFIAGIVSYFVMRNLKINCWVASLLSSVFALSPYMLCRNISHIVLTECYFVPLSILLCIWIYERDDVLAINKDFFKKPINYVAFLFTFLIANNGIAYYPFFTCFILLVTAVSKLVKTRKIKEALRGIIAVVMICFNVVLAILPGKIYTLQHGVNASAIDRGGFYQAEIYGMKISQLFMPVNGHGIYDKYIDIYNDYGQLVNENWTSYLGIMGMIGFIILMICLFIQKQDEVRNRLRILSELNVFMVLLGTIGGIGAMFAFFVSPMLRGYNRISIFVEYVSLLAVAILLTEFIKYCQKKYGSFKVRRRTAFAITVAVTGCACLISIWEGCPDLATPDYESIEAEYTSDREFVEAIESQTEAGSMIYQLPYHPYPEWGVVNEMNDYDLFVGFLHSKTLKWSYGNIKGRTEDEWAENVSEMSEKEMVKYLKEQGFAGIYIDRRAYTEEEIEELENELISIIGNKPLESANKNLSYFAF